MNLDFGGWIEHKTPRSNLIVDQLMVSWQIYYYTPNGKWTCHDGMSGNDFKNRIPISHKSDLTFELRELITHKNTGEKLVFS